MRSPDPMERVLALAEGSIRADGGSLAPDVQSWLASPEQGLSAAIDRASGIDATVDALRRLAPSELTVVGTARGNTASWAEVVRRTHDTTEETSLLGLTQNDDLTVSRLIWLRAPAVPPADIDEGASVGDARALLESYFCDLMHSRFREAASHFTPDTVYSHPPYAGGTTRVLYVGREALWNGFVTDRGESPVRQVITGFWQDGSRAFIEGIIEGIPDGGTFVSAAQITPSSQIARYVAFYSSRRIPG